MKTIDISHDIDCETFLENATEDVSSFDWMLEKRIFSPDIPIF